MNPRKRTLIYLVVLIAIVSVVVATASAQPQRDHALNTGADSSSLKTAAVLGEVEGAGGSAIYIIQFQDPPLASYRGGIDRLEATNPAARGEVKVDVDSAASRAYLAYLESEHSAFLNSLELLTGRSVAVNFDYLYAYNGMAVTLTREEAEDALALPGVLRIQRDFDRYIQTDAGPTWIGAPGIWDGSDTGGLGGTFGEGVIVGIIDTGLNMDHPSFADVGGDGYDHTNPYGSGNYVGLCDTDPGNWICNDKLIGYWIFTAETTEDTDGHGSNVAGIAVGNALNSITMEISATIDVGGRTIDTINDYTYNADISGVAPHANLVGYDACNDTGGCPLSALIGSINRTIPDGVDVINYSIGGSSSNPWTDADSLAFLGTVDAGIVPVTSAGNAGPGPGTIGSPNDAPWMLAVGASFHNRQFPNGLGNMTGGDTTPPGDIDGAGFTSGYGPAPIVYAGDYGDALCGSPFPEGTFTDNPIVVCDRGTFFRVEKGVNVLAGGAGGYILANANASQTLNADAHALPAVHILFDDGVALKSWIASGSGHMATIAGSTLSTDPANGDQMASFSSRGPNPSVPDVIKPDVTAPGVDILSAYKTNNWLPTNFQDEYGFVSGTSQSSPHAAGSATLVRALHPDWSPAEVKSALMSTGWQDVVKEDDLTPADPFDIGGGRVDLSRAGRAGLIWDISLADYVAANPGAGGQPGTLNLASMGENQCAEGCSWTRTVSSPITETATWTVTTDAAPGMVISVEPESFTLAPGAERELTISAVVDGLPLGDWVFGAVTLTPDDSAYPPARMPVAVVPATAQANLAVAKTVSDDGSCGTSSTLAVAPGTEVTYCYTMENTGTAVLAVHTVDDDQLGLIGGGPITYTVFAGEQMVLTATAVISEAVNNVVTWSAESLGGLTAEDTASATVNVQLATYLPLIQNGVNGAQTSPVSSALFMGAMMIPVMAMGILPYWRGRRRDH
jgi:hypothetical protein